MKNPNDNSAAVYDQVNEPLKGFDVISQEIELIKNEIGNGKSILDIGCGTGRHLIYLLQMGFEIDGIDDSSGMLRVLNSKLNQILRSDRVNYTPEILLTDIFKFKTSKKWDMAILMWNTFNEIALTEVLAIKLLKIIKNLLKPNGKVLINIDDASKIDPSNFDFETSNRNIKQTWTVKSFDAKTNTTISEEKITIQENGETKTIVSEIEQRWWRIEEINKFVEKIGFKVKPKEIKANEELYLFLYS